jgi:DNA repair exonuclease SbcCD ATPase subunit
MILKTAVFRNFCQLQDKTIHFEPGMNLVVGPCGTGKTNMLRGLELCLTGDAGGESTKAENIYQLAGKKDKSYVELMLAHGDSSYDIHRGIRPGKTWMQAPDGKYDGATDVNNALWQILGVTKAQLQNYVFVKQQAIASLIDMSPTARSKELMQLFGVAKADKIWIELGRFLTTIAAPTAASSEAAHREAIAAVTTTIQQLQTRIGDLQLPDDIEAYCRERQTVVTDAYVANQLAQEEALLQQALQTAAETLEPLLARAKKAAEDGATLKAAIDRTAPAATAGRHGLQLWVAYDAMAKARGNCETLKQELAAAMELSPTLPDKPADLLEGEALEAAINRNQELVNLMLTSGRDEEVLQSQADDCPTCGQALPGAEDRAARLAAIKQEREERNEEHLPLIAKLTAVDEYHAAVEDMQAKLENIRDLTARVRTAEAAIAEAPQPAKAREECQKAIDSLQSYEDALEDITSQSANLAREAAALEGNVTAYTEQLAAKREQVRELRAPTPAAVEAAKGEIATVRDGVERRTSLEKQLAVAETQLRQQEAALADTLRIDREAAAVRATVEHMSGIRHVYHSGEAPRTLSYTYLERLEDDVNETLKLFDAPFVVAPDDNMGWTASFHDGRVMPDKRLSVGERIILSWSFRIAINAMFVGNLGTLLMDEPTAGLDKAYLKCLEPALEKLRDLSQQRGLQVLFVTHEERIKHLFDHVVTL